MENNSEKEKPQDEFTLKPQPDESVSAARAHEPEIDQEGTSSAEASPSLVEKIQSAASSAYQRIVQPGRGRPRKDGQPKKSDIVLDSASAGGAGGAAPVQVDFGAVTVSKAASAVVKSVCGVAEARIFKLAKMRSGGDEKFAESIVVDLRPTQEELDAIGELSNICLKKYGVGTKYAPEIGLGAVVLGIGVRYTVALKKLTDDVPKIVPMPKVGGK